MAVFDLKSIYCSKWFRKSAFAEAFLSIAVFCSCMSPESRALLTVFGFHFRCRVQKHRSGEISRFSQGSGVVQRPGPCHPWAVRSWRLLCRVSRGFIRERSSGIYLPLLQHLLCPQFRWSNNRKEGDKIEVVSASIILCSAAMFTAGFWNLCCRLLRRYLIRSSWSSTSGMVIFPNSCRM